MGLLELVKRAEEYEAGYLAEKASHLQNSEGDDIALADLLPQVSTSATKTESSGRQGGDEWLLNAGVSHNTFHLPFWRAWKVAKEQVRLTDTNLESALHNLRREVIIAWLEYQRRADGLALIATRQRTLHEQAERSAVLAEAGTVTRTDVLSARASLAGVIAQWEQAKQDLQIAADTLERLSGGAAHIRYLSTDPAAFPKPAPFDDWWTAISADNLSLRASRQSVDIAKGRLEVAELTIYPQLKLSADWQAEESVRHDSGLFRVVITQPLYTGGRTRAQYRQTIAGVSIARQRHQAQQRKIRQEARRIHRQLNTDIARMNALSEGSISARQSLNSIIVGYQNGINIAGDVLRAEEDLFNAESQLRQVAFSYLRHWVELNSLGVLSDDAFVETIEAFFDKEEKK